MVEHLQRLADDLATLLTPGAVLLIGETPGTNELPALTELLVDRALREVNEVIVGLEIPMTEPVDGSGHGSFFARDDELLDGRSSTAVAELIDALAALPGARTVALDGPWVAPGAPIPLEHIGMLNQPRDAVMAGRLLEEIDKIPRAATLVLAGSMHTRVDRPNRTLGGLIAPWFPKLVSLLALTTGGEAWTLTVDGPGPQPVLADPGLPIGVEWATALGADGHHGYVNVGPGTASPPLQRHSRS